MKQLKHKNLAISVDNTNNIYRMFNLLVVKLLIGSLIKKQLTAKYVKKQNFISWVLDANTAEHVAR